ncbi:MAG: HTH-type transcriptional repressor SmtB [Planctomycetes bacterium ADurb.Bin401]|nr:MAG: HTH-type transcriptional repressor SmtB [Planctomycetes bacterium ADurb.Bin401]
MDAKTKKMVYEKQAEILKALANPVRVAIIDFLKDGEQCVCNIADIVDSERSNVSKHLSVLVSNGILEYRKVGQNMMYRLKAKCLLAFFDCLTTCLKQQANENVKLLKAI